MILMYFIIPNSRKMSFPNLKYFKENKLNRSWIKHNNINKELAAE